MRFDDKTVLVTGGGQGIGKAISLAFARAGARVVLAARTPETLEQTRHEIEQIGSSALVVPTDLRDPGQIEALAARTLESWGPVDVLVNNSGIAGPNGVELWNIDLGEWDETFAVNVRGVFLMCRAFLPSMIERRSGNVVVIGSLSGKRPLYGRTPYVTTKAALVGMVRTLAWELGPYDIRVNLISPAGGEGPRLDSVITGQAKATGKSEDDIRQMFKDQSPMKRFTPADDVAKATLFLASDYASSTTGEDLNVSAGLVMY
jgi:NAD(P)-dependent dehydrogenase (short-subunit alcohol dehydrogenase family)